MIEFKHTLTQPEINSQYINLNDESRNSYGDQIGKTGKLFTVVDDANNKFEMRRNSSNQLTRCASWFEKHRPKAGTILTIRFDPQTATIRLLRQPATSPVIPTPLGSVSFTHDGDYYEIRCAADGEVVRVCGFRDGKQVSSFDFPPTPKIRKRRIDISEFV
jgi:hypothetical protein